MNAVPIVEKLPNDWERRSIVRTHTDGIANHFQPKMQYIAGFCKYKCICPRAPRKRSRCLDPDTNFRLARQHYHCSDSAKRPLPHLLIDPARNESQEMSTAGRRRNGARRTTSSAAPTKASRSSSPTNFSTTRSTPTTTTTGRRW